MVKLCQNKDNKIDTQRKIIKITQRKVIKITQKYGKKDYERALALHSDTREGDNLLTPLVAALRAKDEDAAEALLDGGDDPNEVDECRRNALHMAAWAGCRLPLFHRILGMIHNVNAVNDMGWTALMWAAAWNHLDMVVSLMKHRWIDVNVQGVANFTALHWAVLLDSHATLAPLLSDDRVDTSLKNDTNMTPLRMAIHCKRDECVKILREHGAPEE